MTSKHTGDVSKDIGTNAPSREAIFDVWLKSDEQTVLEEINSAIGNEQITLKKLNFALPWIVLIEVDAEAASNWDGVYNEEQKKNILRNENVITSHIIFKLKQKKKGSARLCPHENRDKCK